MIWRVVCCAMQSHRTTWPRTNRTPLVFDWPYRIDSNWFVHRIDSNRFELYIPSSIASRRNSHTDRCSSWYCSKFWSDQNIQTAYDKYINLYSPAIFDTTHTSIQHIKYTNSVYQYTKNKYIIMGIVSFTRQLSQRPSGFY